MPGEEAGGALGSFGDILVSGDSPALTLGAGSGNTAGGGSGGAGWEARECCNSRRAA